MERRRLDLNNPFVASGFCEGWPSLSWTQAKLSEILAEKTLTCRVSEINCGKTLETECAHFDISMNDFNNWLREDSHQPSHLTDFRRDKYCCYIDYKYMKDIFSDQPEVFSHVMWSTLGLPEFDGSDSTVWIGSEGANTPCHQDTYGFNLVTQIQGKKLWILFPPEDSDLLYSSRIPYEESSIFSAVNVRNPDLFSFPLFKDSHPVIVVLNPGQTLYVPRHWWHYVQSLEPSISVNVWVPVVEDKESRYHEAITRTLASSLIRDFTDLDKEGKDGYDHWLNPTETLTDSRINVEFLKTSLVQFLEGEELLTDIGGTMFVSKDINSTEQSRTTEMKSVSEGTDYLQKLASAMESYPVYKVSSPFDVNCLKRKFVDTVAGTSCLKKSKSSSGQTCNEKSKSREFEMSKGDSLHMDVGEGRGSSKTLCNLDYCSMDVYLKYVQDLCVKSNCSCLKDSQKQHENSSAHQTQIKSATVQPSLSPQLGSQSTLPEASCSSLSVASSYSHTELPQHEDLNVKGSPAGNGSENNGGDMTSNKTKRLEQGYYKLTQTDFAEAFLSSILHPDIVQAVSVKFKDQCDILLKNKSRKST